MLMIMRKKRKDCCTSGRKLAIIGVENLNRRDL